MIKNVRLILLGVLVFTWSHNASCQHVRKLDSQTPARASLEQVRWISGHWQGEAFGGPVEEIWSEPLGNSMMFCFKSVNENGEVVFYEFGTLTEEDGTLYLRFKHFTSGLEGWEEKNEHMEYQLVEVTENEIFFDEFTFRRISENQMIVYVVLENNKGEQKETAFEYTRR